MNFGTFILDVINFFFTHYLVALISLFAIIITIHVNPKIGKFKTTAFLALPIIIIFLMINESINITLSELTVPYNTYLRQVILVIGFWVYPLIAAFSFRIVHRPTTILMKHLIWVPFLINFIIYARCLFPHGFFEITADNQYINAYPEVAWLSLTVFFTGGIYALGLVGIGIRAIIRHKYIDGISIIVIGTFGMSGFVMDYILQSPGYGCSVVSASCLAFLVFQLTKFMKIDPLTGVYNRQAFYNYKNKEKSVNGIISLDLNNLKEINDKYGHQKGDESLEIVANVIKVHTLKLSCVPFRVGGDEFIILCMKMTEKEAYNLVEILDDEINNKTNVRVAIGLCYRSRANETIDEMIGKSDAFMYKMKKLMKM